jgi:replicative DNA helicase
MKPHRKPPDDNARAQRGNRVHNPEEGAKARAKNGGSPEPIKETAKPVSAGEEAPWEPVLRFDARELPPFPLAQLPPVIAAMVAATAEATQTPPDMAALLSLTTLSICCAGKVDVEILPDWKEPLNSYVAVVMGSANGKSGVVKKMTMGPIAEYERQRLAEIMPQIARQQSDWEARRQRKEELTRKAAKEENSDERERLQAAAADEAAWLVRNPRPEVPRLLSDDVTPEAIASLMSANGERLAIVSAEGGLFETMGGRYSNGVANVDIFLKGYSGDEVRVDRRNKEKPPIELREPALTIGVAVQPDVLRVLLSNPVFLERGLPARFWMATPKSLMGYRNLDAQPIPPLVRAAYTSVIHRLLSETPASADERPRITLSPAARVVHRAFRESIELELRPDGCFAGGGVQSWAGKLAGSVARIAGLLHCALVGDLGGEIKGPTMEAAVEIGRYLAEHAIAAHEALGADPDVEIAKRAVGWIERHRRTAFALRDLFNGLKGSGSRIQKKKDLEQALQLLTEHGYIRLRDPSAPAGARKPGRPPGPEYEINPEIISSFSPDLPQNPQNHPDTAPGRRFEGFAGGNGGEISRGTRPTSQPRRPGDSVVTTLDVQARAALDRIRGSS